MFFLRNVNSVLPLLVLVLITLLILLVPIMLIANGVLMIRREGKSLANLLSLFIGLGIGAGELCGMGFVGIVGIGSIKDDFLEHISQWVFLLLLFVCMSAIYFSISFLAFMFYTVFLQTIPRKRDFDYIIIHGAGLINGNKVSKLLADRIDKAIAVYKNCPTPPIMIPSGGKGSDEDLSEAEAMAGYLKEHGIPEEQIILEDKSTTTRENLIFSKNIIENRDGNHYTALVTSNYHVYRALRYCKKIGLNCTGIGSRVAPYYWPSALIREYIAIHAEKKHLITLIGGWLLLIVWPLFAVFA